MIRSYEKFLESLDKKETITLYHAGNLDDFNYNHLEKINFNRIKYGYGLYTVDSIDVALRFYNESKNNKLYELNVNKGNDIKGTMLYSNSVIILIERYGIKSKIKELKKFIENFEIDGKIDTEVIYNYIFNNRLIKSTNLTEFMNFMIANDIDYEIKYNSYFKNENTYMIYNLNLINSITDITPIV